MQQDLKFMGMWFPSSPESGAMDDENIKTKNIHHTGKLYFMV